MPSTVSRQATKFQTAMLLPGRPAGAPGTRAECWPRWPSNRALQGAAWFDPRAEVTSRWSLWRQEKSARAADDAAHGIGAAAVMASLSRLIDPSAVIAVDVGNNTYSFGRYFEA